MRHANGTGRHTYCDSPRDSVKRWTHALKCGQRSIIHWIPISYTNGYNDASLGYLRRRIQDKASSAGREMILVDPKGTSQTCSMCGEIVKKDLSVRVHECPHCKTSMDRDVNAARNILFRSGLVPAPWVDRPPASRA